MDVNEIARGLAVEHMGDLAELRVGQMKVVKLPPGSSRLKPEISEAMGRWLEELVPDASFEIHVAGLVDLAIKRTAQ